MSNTFDIKRSEWLNIIAEYNVAYNNPGAVKDYYEDDLHNGKWKILPISFCGKATPTALKYLPEALAFCDNWDTLTASIHVLEPGCIVEQHVDDDFDVEVTRYHIPIFGFSINDISGTYKSHKISDGVDIYEFDTTVPHTVKNTHPYNIVFLIIDFENPTQPVDPYTKRKLYETFKEVGYFS